jgi:hypothetical protein
MSCSGRGRRKRWSLAAELSVSRFEVPPSTQFLNVDLDVYAPYPLGSLARAIESCGALTLHSGRWWKGGFRASFEIVDSTRSANVAIRSSRKS